jgi:hypothetical protein
MTYFFVQKFVKTNGTTKQKTTKDLEDEEEEERPLMIKRRKQMRGAIINLEVLASHTVPRPQHP